MNLKNNQTKEKKICRHYDHCKATEDIVFMDHHHSDTHICKGMNNPNSDIEKAVHLFSSKPMCTEDNPCGCHFGETLHLDKICFCTIVDEIKSLIEKSLLSIREKTLREVEENIIPTPRIKLSYFQERFIKENEGVRENNEELKGWNELRRLQIKALAKLKSQIKSELAKKI